MSVTSVDTTQKINTNVHTVAPHHVHTGMTTDSKEFL